MARINIEDQWWIDPRRASLSRRLGCELKADGAAIRLWRTSQEFWKKKQLIPDSIFTQLEYWEDLVSVGLAEKSSEGFYAKGSKEHHEWLLTRVEAGRSGGKKSGASRRGDFKDLVEAKRKQNEAKRKQNEAKGKQTQPSSSSSSSSSSSISNTNINTNTVSSELENSSPRNGCVDRLRFSNFCEKFLGSVKIKSQEVWLELYPDAEFLKREFLKIEEWVTRNPAKSPKSANGTARFIGGWLERGWESYRKTIQPAQEKSGAQQWLEKKLAEEALKRNHDGIY